MAPFTVHRTGRPARWGTWSDLFEDFMREATADFGGRSGRALPSVGVYPPVNLHETEEAYVLTAELPGVAPEAIDVSLEGTTVTISGERKIDYAAGDGTAVHRRERQSGHFKRAFELPTKFDLDRVEARHRDGVLELHLPKSAETRARTIPVQTR